MNRYYVNLIQVDSSIDRRDACMIFYSTKFQPAICLMDRFFDLSSQSDLQTRVPVELRLRTFVFYWISRR